MKTNVNAPGLMRQRNGLLGVASVVDGGDERWEDGINFTPRGCSVIFGHDTKCWFPRGNKLIHKVNGQVTCEIIDHQLALRGRA